ncbi:MAG: flagellar hook-length control protein FliK [Gammaproteobacteria bacterium]
MKVQSAKPQISNQAPSPIEDLQLDGDFTEAFAELVAAMQMEKPPAVDQVAKETLEFDEVSKKEDEPVVEDTALQDTLSTILFGLNIPVVDNTKLANQTIDDEKDKTPDLKLDTQSLKGDVDLDLSPLTKVNNATDDKFNLDISDKFADKNKEAEPLVKLNLFEQDPAVDVTKNMNTTVAHAVAHSIVQSDQNTLTLQDKPANALQELGKLINQHTNVIPEETKTVNTLSRPAATYTQTLDKLSQIEPGMNITKTIAMVGSSLKDVYTANIKIHPPELGQVTATLKVDKNNAELVLLTENDHVKAIVQSQLTQLRENFQKADLYLTNIDVQTSHSDAERQQQEPAPRNTSNINQGIKEDAVELKEPKTVSQRINSLIDTYV